MEQLRIWIEEKLRQLNLERTAAQQNNNNNQLQRVTGKIEMLTEVQNRITEI